MYYDKWNEENRECVSYVAWMLSSVNGFTMPFNDNAVGWKAKAQNLGYTVDMAPKPGSIFWTAAPTNIGHVAYVESVSTDGTHVTTEDYNQANTGVWAEHPNILTSSADGYIHFKDLNPPPTTTKAPAAIQYGSEMDVYKVASDKHVYKDTWNGSSWGGWSSMNTTVTMASDPTAIQYNSEMDVFAVGTDGHVYKDTWNGSSWGGFGSLGGTFLTNRPAALQYNSEMDVFANNSDDNGIYKDTWSGTSWSGFGWLGGTLTSSPAAIQYNSEMDVYATDANSTVYKDTWNGTSWGGFTQL